MYTLQSCCRLFYLCFVYVHLSCFYIIQLNIYRVRTAQRRYIIIIYSRKSYLKEGVCLKFISCNWKHLLNHKLQLPIPHRIYWSCLQQVQYVHEYCCDELFTLSSYKERFYAPKYRMVHYSNCNIVGCQFLYIQYTLSKMKEACKLVGQDKLYLCYVLKSDSLLNYTINIFFINENSAKLTFNILKFKRKVVLTHIFEQELKKRAIVIVNR